jgi:hypothetical protein
VGASALGLGLHLGAVVPKERSFPSVLDGVERATGVRASAAAWEPSRGALVDLLSGRPLLLTGRTEADAFDDVYRVFVRVAPDGAPLAVTRSYNLTSTLLADERALLVRGPLAAYATVAFDHVQSLTVLDGRGVYGVGEGGDWLGRGLHRLELGVQALLETGTLRGLGRTDVEFAHPPARLEFELSPSALRVVSGARERAYGVGPLGLEATGAAGADQGDAELAVLPRLSPPKPALHWMADAGRSVLGSGPIAWLEGRAFTLLDHLRRFSYAFRRSDNGADELATHVAPTLPSPTPTLDAESASGAALWPPPSIPSPWRTPRPGEGEWQPVELPFLRRTAGAEDAPPYFYRTFVRPDRERPYAEVTLVAMDMRRLELGVEGGYEDPRPSAGPPGTGHVPSDPDSYRRIVATFNGAFKTSHGDYGMVVNRRVLVPPVAGAATVRIDRSGAVGLGTWPAPQANDGQDGTLVLPAELLSLRQNLDPLLEDGRVNPAGRKVWGSQLYGQGVAAERSALCVTNSGHLVYAWSEEASGETLGEALRMGGCDYGVHLDMNPGHCAFVFTNILDFQRVEAQTEVLDPRMRINPTRYIRWSPKDFFYVSLRSPVPKTPGVTWQAAEGAQGDPSWMPGIFRSELRVGPLAVQLLRFSADRLRWQLVPGSAEPLRPNSTRLPFTEADAARALVAFGVGHSTPAARHGLAFGSHQAVPLDPALATLVLPHEGAARLEAPGTPLRPMPGQTLVQLPLLSQDGELTARGRQPGALRQRGALCVDGEGNLLLARVHHDSSGPLAQALLKLDCGLVVEMDRGSQHPVFVERAGSDRPPRAGHETTVLYGMDRPGAPRAYWWRSALGQGPPKPPTGS